MKKFISICIPYYNTSVLTKKTISSLVKNNFINEVIVSDDCSIKKFSYNHPKVKVYRNASNLGSFKNKFKSIQRATNDWVFLLDSDNFIESKVLKKLFINLNKKFFNEDFYYSSSKIILENVDSDKKLNNKIIHYNFANKIIDYTLACKNILIKKYFDWFLNTGNFFINRNKYLQCFKKILIKSKFDPKGADSIFFSYYWLVSGKKIMILDDLYYFHRIRKDSLISSSDNTDAIYRCTKLFLDKQNFFSKNIFFFYTIYIKYFFKKFIKKILFFYILKKDV